MFFDWRHDPWIPTKMQLDVDIEPTIRFPHITSIDKQMDKSEGSLPLYMVVQHFYHRQTESDA